MEVEYGNSCSSFNLFVVNPDLHLPGSIRQEREKPRAVGPPRNFVRLGRGSSLGGIVIREIACESPNVSGRYGNQRPLDLTR